MASKKIKNRISKNSKSRDYCDVTECLLHFELVEIHYDPNNSMQPGQDPDWEFFKFYWEVEPGTTVNMGSNDDGLGGVKIWWRTSTTKYVSFQFGANLESQATFEDACGYPAPTSAADVPLPYELGNTESTGNSGYLTFVRKKLIYDPDPPNQLQVFVNGTFNGAFGTFCDICGGNGPAPNELTYSEAGFTLPPDDENSGDSATLLPFHGSGLRSGAITNDGSPIYGASQAIWVEDQEGNLLDIVTYSNGTSPDMPRTDDLTIEEDMFYTQGWDGCDPWPNIRDNAEDAGMLECDVTCDCSSIIGWPDANDYYFINQNYFPGTKHNYGASIQLKEVGNDSDNNVGSNWVASQGCGSPGLPNSINYVNSIIITEILYKFDTASFIEIWNLTEDFIDISGFSIYDDYEGAGGTKITFPAGTIIAANGDDNDRIVVAKCPTLLDFENGAACQSLDSADWNPMFGDLVADENLFYLEGTLGDLGEKVYIKDKFNEIVDYVNYTTMLEIPQTSNYSIQLKPNIEEEALSSTIDNNNPENWQSSNIPWGDPGTTTIETVQGCMIEQACNFNSAATSACWDYEENDCCEYTANCLLGCGGTYCPADGSQNELCTPPQQCNLVNTEFEDFSGNDPAYMYCSTSNIWCPDSTGVLTEYESAIEQCKYSIGCGCKTPEENETVLQDCTFGDTCYPAYYCTSVSWIDSGGETWGDDPEECQDTYAADCGGCGYDIHYCNEGNECDDGNCPDFYCPSEGTIVLEFLVNDVQESTEFIWNGLTDDIQNIFSLENVEGIESIPSQVVKITEGATASIAQWYAGFGWYGGFTSVENGQTYFFSNYSEIDLTLTYTFGGVSECCNTDDCGICNGAGSQSGYYITCCDCAGDCDEFTCTLTTCLCDDTDTCDAQGLGPGCTCSAQPDGCGVCNGGDQDYLDSCSGVAGIDMNEDQCIDGTWDAGGWPTNGCCCGCESDPPTDYYFDSDCDGDGAGQAKYYCGSPPEDDVSELPPFNGSGCWSGNDQDTNEYCTTDAEAGGGTWFEQDLQTFYGVDECNICYRTESGDININFNFWDVDNLEPGNAVDCNGNCYGNEAFTGTIDTCDCGVTPINQCADDSWGCDQCGVCGGCNTSCSGCQDEQATNYDEGAELDCSSITPCTSVGCCNYAHDCNNDNAWPAEVCVDLEASGVTDTVGCAWYDNCGICSNGGTDHVANSNMDCRAPDGDLTGFLMCSDALGDCTASSVLNVCGDGICIDVSCALGPGEEQPPLYIPYSPGSTCPEECVLSGQTGILDGECWCSGETIDINNYCCLDGSKDCNNLCLVDVPSGPGNPDALSVMDWSGNCCIITTADTSGLIVDDCGVCAQYDGGDFVQCMQNCPGGYGGIYCLGDCQTDGAFPSSLDGLGHCCLNTETGQYYLDTDGDGQGVDPAFTLCHDNPLVVDSSYVQDSTGDQYPDCNPTDTNECTICDLSGIVDDCGNCNGGNEAQDCAGLCGGDDVLDECGICAGDSSSCADCSGDPSGDAVEDCNGCCSVNGGECDYLPDDSENGQNWSYNQSGIFNGSGNLGYDCNGDCGYNAILDVCQTCRENGEGNLEWNTELDCADTCHPDSPISSICDGGNGYNIWSAECLEHYGNGGGGVDCDGDCGGDNQPDQCNSCGGDGSGCLGCQIDSDPEHDDPCNQNGYAGNPYGIPCTSETHPNEGKCVDYQAGATDYNCCCMWESCDGGCDCWEPGDLGEGGYGGPGCAVLDSCEQCGQNTVCEGCSDPNALNYSEISYNADYDTNGSCGDWMTSNNYCCVYGNIITIPDTSKGFWENKFKVRIAGNDIREKVRYYTERDWPGAWDNETQLGSAIISPDTIIDHHYVDVLNPNWGGVVLSNNILNDDTEPQPEGPVIDHYTIQAKIFDESTQEWVNSGLIHCGDTFYNSYIPEYANGFPQGSQGIQTAPCIDVNVNSSSTEEDCMDTGGYWWDSETMFCHSYEINDCDVYPSRNNIENLIRNGMTCYSEITGDHLIEVKVYVRGNTQEVIGNGSFMGDLPFDLGDISCNDCCCDPVFCEGVCAGTCNPLDGGFSNCDADGQVAPYWLMTTFSNILHMLAHAELKQSVDHGYKPQQGIEFCKTDYPYNNVVCDEGDTYSSGCVDLNAGSWPEIMCDNTDSSNVCLNYENEGYNSPTIEYSQTEFWMNTYNTAGREMLGTFTFDEYQCLSYQTLNDYDSVETNICDIKWESIVATYWTDYTINMVDDSDTLCTTTLYDITEYADSYVCTTCTLNAVDDDGLTCVGELNGCCIPNEYEEDFWLEDIPDGSWALTGKQCVTYIDSNGIQQVWGANDTGFVCQNHGDVAGCIIDNYPNDAKVWETRTVCPHFTKSNFQLQNSDGDNNRFLPDAYVATRESLLKTYDSSPYNYYDEDCYKKNYICCQSNDPDCEVVSTAICESGKANFYGYVCSSTPCQGDDYNLLDCENHRNLIKYITAPTEVLFVFYPREWGCLFEERAILESEWDSGDFYVGTIDWNDGSDLDYIDKPVLLSKETILAHFYEEPGIYTVTGYMFRMNRSLSELDQDDVDDVSVTNHVSYWTKFTTRFKIYTMDEITFSDDKAFINYNNTSPVIGGISENSIYYKSIMRQLGYLPDLPSPIDLQFKNYQDKLNTEYALAKMDDNLVPPAISAQTGSLYNMNDGDSTEWELLNTGEYKNLHGELGKYFGQSDIGQVRYYNRGDLDMSEMLGFKNYGVDNSFVFLDGVGAVLFTSPHGPRTLRPSISPSSDHVQDTFTSAMAHKLHELTNAPVLYSIYSQDDPNYYHYIGIDVPKNKTVSTVTPAFEGMEGELHPFKRKLKEYLEANPRIKLVIDIHGAADYRTFAVDLGTSGEYNKHVEGILSSELVATAGYIEMEPYATSRSHFTDWDYYPDSWCNTIDPTGASCTPRYSLDDMQGDRDNLMPAVVTDYGIGWTSEQNPNGDFLLEDIVRLFNEENVGAGFGYHDGPSSAFSSDEGQHYDGEWVDNISPHGCPGGQGYEGSYNVYCGNNCEDNYLDGSIHCIYNISNDWKKPITFNQDFPSRSQQTVTRFVSQDARRASNYYDFDLTPADFIGKVDALQFEFNRNYRRFEYDEPVDMRAMKSLIKIRDHVNAFYNQNIDPSYDQIDWDNESGTIFSDISKIWGYCKSGQCYGGDNDGGYCISVSDPVYGCFGTHRHSSVVLFDKDIAFNQNNPSNPGSKRYWKNIIPEDYDILAREGININLQPNGDFSDKNLTGWNITYLGTPPIDFSQTAIVDDETSMENYLHIEWKIDNSQNLTGGDYIQFVLQSDYKNGVYWTIPGEYQYSFEIRLNSGNIPIYANASYTPNELDVGGAYALGGLTVGIWNPVVINKVYNINELDLNTNLQAIFELFTDELDNSICPGGCYINFDIKNIKVDLIEAFDEASKYFNPDADKIMSIDANSTFRWRSYNSGDINISTTDGELGTDNMVSIYQEPYYPVLPKLNVFGLFTDKLPTGYNNEDWNLRFDPDFYYPGDERSHDVGVGMTTHTPFGFEDRRWDEIDYNSAAINERFDTFEYYNDLLFDISMGQLIDGELLEDISGNNNNGIVTSDYRVLFDKETTKPSKSENSSVPELEESERRQY